MASQAGDQQKTRAGNVNKGVRDNGVQQRLEACVKTGDEVLLSDHTPPCCENLTLHGKVLWGTSVVCVCAGEFTLSHLGVLTRALQFETGVPIYSKCYLVRSENGNRYHLLPT